MDDSQVGAIVTTPARPANNSASSISTPHVSQLLMATPSTVGNDNWAYDGTGDCMSSQVPPPPPPVQQLHLVQASGPQQIQLPLSLPSQSLGLHANIKNWLLHDCPRQSAEQLLSNKPDGTFLIRRSTTSSAPYALSIAYRGVDKGIGHIQILRSERGAYGFTEPYLLFPNLVDLVLYYATHSLEEHNPDLTTTLAYPLYGQEPEINHYVL